jgi:hypothetical protein
MKKLTPFLIMAMLTVGGTGFFPAQTGALDLLEGTELSKQYLLELSGTVMNETFSGAQALLTLLPPAPASKYNNPYQVIIEGYPQKNSRNSFFWRSEDSPMTAIANDITCDIKRTYIKEVPMYFIFLSPELLRHYGSAYEEERYALNVALPTFVNARAGKLKLRIHSDTVSGTVWMKGFDPVEKAWVMYSAKLHGKKSFNLKPNEEKRLIEAK